MRISPISKNQYQPSHKAINQKYLKMAIEDYNKYKPYQHFGPIITSICLAVLYHQMSKQDAIDTLNAIKPYDNDKKAIDDTIEELNSCED